MQSHNWLVDDYGYVHDRDCDCDCDCAHGYDHGYDYVPFLSLLLKFNYDKHAQLLVVPFH